MFDMTCEMPKALIKEGWQPYGSPYIDKEGRDCQAMVKYEQPDCDFDDKDEDEDEDDGILASKNYYKRLADELKARNDALLKNYETLMQQKLAAFDEMAQLKKEIALLSERAQPRDGALKTCLEQNEQLKYTIDGNTVLIKSLSKENELLQSRIRELLKENFQESKKKQQLSHLVAECSRCMTKASEL